MVIEFGGRVAIVTGAGAGLGRAHALGLASRGAAVVVNDRSAQAAERVVAEIEEAGGRAIGASADVTDFNQISAMVDVTMSKWGRVDILVNNAGILRDKTFANMDLSDFRVVIDVHLMGSVNCTKAVWNIMREQQYGRVIFTSSASGLYGNFGQANYGAAKAAFVGLMNVLDLEGAKYNILVNCLSPTAATAMTRNLFSKEQIDVLDPESVTPGVLFLASERAPSKTILCAGAGCFAVTLVSETEGIILSGSELAPETIAARFAEISAPIGARAMRDALAQTDKYVSKRREVDSRE